VNSVSIWLTLFTTPVVYLYLDRLRWRLAGIKGRFSRPETLPGPEPVGD